MLRYKLQGPVRVCNNVQLDLDYKFGTVEASLDIAKSGIQEVRRILSDEDYGCLKDTLDNISTALETAAENPLLMDEVEEIQADLDNLLGEEYEEIRLIDRVEEIWG